MKRRDFVKQTALTASLIPFMGLSKLTRASAAEAPLSISIFSKHLQFLDYAALGEKAAEMGFAGVDLTVRPDGHVVPEHAETQLPKAVEAIRNAGSSCTMISTVIERSTNPVDAAIIAGAGAQGVSFYRTNWFKYKPDRSMEASISYYQQEIQALGALNKKAGIVGCYQNHAGTTVGSSFWEIKKMLELADPAFFGVQYDVRHAIVEGGNSWVNGLQLLKSNIKCIVLKDFKWGKIKDKWAPVNVPIGEGMVDFVAYFRLLKKYEINPAVSLHLEYDLGGAEKGARNITIDKQQVYEAMKKDHNEIQRLWKLA